MKRSRGFTLLETIIGITILGFVLALLAAGFRLASASSDVIDREVTRTTDEEMARAFVRRIVTRLQPLRWHAASGRPLAFIGDPDRIRAIALMTGRSAAVGLVVVELSAEKGSRSEDGLMQLVIRQAPVQHDAADFAQPLGEATPHVLLNGLTRVDFSYFGPPKPGQPAFWHSTWPSRDTMPKLLRIRLESDDDVWPDILVGTMVSDSGDCRWNSFFKKCLPPPGSVR